VFLISAGDAVRGSSVQNEYQVYQVAGWRQALSGLVASVPESHDNNSSPSQLHPSVVGEDMFRKRRATGSGTSGGNPDQSRCERIQLLACGRPLTHWDPLAKKQRTTDGVKRFLDIAKESSDWFPPLKSALGGVSALVKHYEVMVERVTVVYH